MPRPESMSRWDYFTGSLAKLIVSEVACRINATAVMSLCLQTARLYHEMYSGAAPESGAQDV